MVLPDGDEALCLLEDRLGLGEGRHDCVVRRVLPGTQVQCGGDMCSVEWVVRARCVGVSDGDGDEGGNGGERRVCR